MSFQSTIDTLDATGNLREVPGDTPAGTIDLSSNDYLGLGVRADLRDNFLKGAIGGATTMTSSASRLLAGCQESYSILERRIGELYARQALLFNSGYHANTGIIGAIASLPGTLVVADKLVHASIIDGIILSRAPFKRFRHNDFGHLERILKAERGKWEQIIIIAESIYSMDGDRADIDALSELRNINPGSILYIDEAHAVGVTGPAGLGLSMAARHPENVDIIVGTFGKALASCGAWAAVSPVIRSFLVNRARSFIFSTALPPIMADWSLRMLEQSLTMDTERSHLAALGHRLASTLGTGTEGSHILPVIIGDARIAMSLSSSLLAEGFKVLPIRTPTVPAGTERLRISLSAAIDFDTIDHFADTLNRLRQ